ncbi:hypothetical protein [Gordonia sp. VNK21]|uniref:hypothetical protein n=2 Tax=Gordonia sp. VNK21 TaxID=3382483 RepID=UPI0038D48CDC
MTADQAPGGYRRVRFIGYAVPTTPAQVVAVGDPNGTGNVAGTYRAAEDFADDVRLRAGLLKRAVDAARDALPDADGQVLNVFVAPEFFWHGLLGPYVHALDEPDPAGHILAVLEELFPAADYPHFLLVLGSAISAQVADLDAVLNSTSTAVRNDVVRTLGEAWARADGPLALVVYDALVDFIKNCHAYPQVQVRNRAFVLGPGALSGVRGDFRARAVTTEKFFASNEDLLLWDVTGRSVITEQMSAYPVLDTSGGDLKSAAHDPYAIFSVPGERPVTVGVEICLDHADHRLRRGVVRSRWPEAATGLELHLLPSCGMSIHGSAVAAAAGGWVFNCDGQYGLGDPEQAGRPQRGTLGAVPCDYVDYLDASGAGAHTQLARVRRPASGADVRGPGSTDAVFAPAAGASVTVIPVASGPDVERCFAGGPGAVHVYGADHPLPLHGDV